MSNLIIQKFLKSQDLTAMRGLHFLAKGIFKASSYRWEVRRSGEIKLGYWKKTLRPRSKGSSYPKRFVLIPGFGDTPLSWHGVMLLLNPVLKKNFDEIILLDFPGFGGFLAQEKSFPTMDFMLKMLGDTLDSLKPHTLLGHSLGGWLSAHYAAECGMGLRPVSNQLNYSGPSTLLLSNPSGIFADENVRKDWESVFRTAMVDGFTALRPHLFRNEPIWFSLVASHFSKFLKREDILQFMGSFREDHIVDRFVEKIQAQVYILWGEHDTLIPVSCVEAWLKHLPESQKSEDRALIVKGVGHSPHLESPAATAAMISQVVAGKQSPRIGKSWWRLIENSL